MWLWYIFLVSEHRLHLHRTMYFLILQCTWCFPIPAVLPHSVPSPAMSSCPQLPDQITSKPNSNVSVSWTSFWLLTEKPSRLPQNVCCSPERQVPCTALLLGDVLAQCWSVGSCGVGLLCTPPCFALNNMCGVKLCEQKANPETHSAHAATAKAEAGSVAHTVTYPR